MQPSGPNTMADLEAEERQELRDKIWMFTQRFAVILVVFLAGIFLGLVRPDMVAPVFRPLGVQGPAGALQEQVDQLTERSQGLVKERDTLRSKEALMDRDKKELEKQLQEAQARAAACASAGTP
jgi:flagellar biosynthesis/type III secretory pathway M-ring protein FliF/YscJ